MYYVNTFVRITDTQHLRDVVEAYAKVGIDEPSLWIKEDMKEEWTSIVAVFPFTKKELYATDEKTSHRTLENNELFLLDGELKSTKETEQNNYIKIYNDAYPDGSMKVTKVEKLRALDPEVKKIFESNRPHIRYYETHTDDKPNDRYGHVLIYGKSGPDHICHKGTHFSATQVSIIQKIISDASERLSQIEKHVFEQRKKQAQPTLTVYGYKEESSLPECAMVLRCKYTNGSVATYAIHTNDKTTYLIGDIVEVENPGYPNDYVKIVGFRYMMGDNPEFPACRVVGKA
jgi:hypothetical protein